MGRQRFSTLQSCMEALHVSTYSAMGRTTCTGSDRVVRVGRTQHLKVDVTAQVEAKGRGLGAPGSHQSARKRRAHGWLERTGLTTKYAEIERCL